VLETTKPQKHGNSRKPPRQQNPCTQKPLWKIKTGSERLGFKFNTLRQWSRDLPECRGRSRLHYTPRCGGHCQNNQKPEKLNTPNRKVIEIDGE